MLIKQTNKQKINKCIKGLHSLTGLRSLLKLAKARQPLGFATYALFFGYQMKHSLSCLIHHIFVFGYDQMKLLLFDALPRSVWISDETLLLLFDTLPRSVKPMNRDVFPVVASLHPIESLCSQATQCLDIR